MIVGPGLEGTVLVAVTDMRSSSRARDVVERFRAQGHEPAGVTLNAYAAVQVGHRLSTLGAHWISIAVTRSHA